MAGAVEFSNVGGAAPAAVSKAALAAAEGDAPAAAPFVGAVTEISGDGRAAAVEGVLGVAKTCGAAAEGALADDGCGWLGAGGAPSTLPMPAPRMRGLRARKDPAAVAAE